MTELVADFTQEYYTALTALHAFTRCDSTSAFKGNGKVKPIKLLQKHPRFQNILAKLGEEWDVSVDVIYGRSRLTSVDEQRCILIKEKCEWKDGAMNLSKHVDLCSLPPSRKALVQHIHRVNYQMGIWRRANTPIIEVPRPTDGHG